MGKRREMASEVLQGIGRERPKTAETKRIRVSAPGSKPQQSRRVKRAIPLTRGMAVCLTWDRNYRGTIVEPGSEVSGMRLEGTKTVVYFANSEYEPV